MAEIMRNDIRKIVRKKSGRTVFWGIRFLPKAKREALYTIVAFIRHLEDIMESSIDKKEKKEILDTWKEELDNIYDKKVPATDIGRRIYKNCMRFKLPKDEFISLLHNISTDVANPIKAPTIKHLQGYCRGVGGIGSGLSLRIFGCKDEDIINDLSFLLGNALQITNILCNVKEDAKHNRLYIPQELLEKAKITSTDPQSVVVDKNLAIAREELALIAEEHYKKSFELLDKLDKQTRKHLIFIVKIYKKLFDTMKERGWEIISPKPRVGRIRKLIILLQTILSD